MSDVNINIVNQLVGKKKKKTTIDTSQDVKSLKHYIIMIIDRSGSMYKMQQKAEDSINEFIDDQKNGSGECFFTLIEFDHEYDVVYDNVNINDVGKYHLEPRGSTAFRDAVGRGFAKANGYVTEGAKMAVIVTDGGENASTEWSHDDMVKRISELTKLGWDFMYLAANMDAVSNSKSYGMDKDLTLNFSADTVNEGYKVASDYTMNLRAGMSKSRAKGVYAASVMNSNLSDSNAHVTTDATDEAE